MCFFNTKVPAPQSVAAPPPPPAEAPKAPAFNEASTQSTNAAAFLDANRRGTKSLRIDLDGAPSSSGLALTN